MKRLAPPAARLSSASADLTIQYGQKSRKIAIFRDFLFRCGLLCAALGQPATCGACLFGRPSPAEKILQKVLT